MDDMVGGDIGAVGSLAWWQEWCTKIGRFPG